MSIVQAAGRLVVHDDFFMGSNCPCYGDALLLSAGKRHGVLIFERQQIQHRQDVLGIPCLFFFRYILDAKRHFIKHALGKELMVYVLHNHIAEFQSLLWLIFLAKKSESTVHFLLQAA